MMNKVQNKSKFKVKYVLGRQVKLLLYCTLYSTLGKTLKTIEATHHPLGAPLYMPWTAKEPPELCTIFF